MRKLAIVLTMLVGLSFHAQTASVTRMAGLGADRANLTDGQVQVRAEQLERNSDFYLLRQTVAQDAPRRIFDPKIWPIIEQAGRDYKLDPLLIASVIYIESAGRTDVKSPTGPAGIGQFSKAAAKDVKIDTHRQVGPNTYVDDRLDPAKAIPGIARRLAEQIGIYGREDFAIQQYHDGGGPVLKLISLYTGIPRPFPLIGPLVSRFRQEVRESTVREIVAMRDLSYADIFFRNTPYFHRSVFDYLADRQKSDYGPTYYFHVMEARRLLVLYRQNPAQYDALYARYRNAFNPTVVLPNRMWGYFTPEQVQRDRFANLLAIQQAKRTGRLVDLPWPGLGFIPRLTGASPIAEKDLLHQREYIALEVPTAGCLLYVIGELKLLQGKLFIPLEVNSLVRSDTTQAALRTINANSRTELPTHTMGKAFDLPLGHKSGTYKHDLLFVIDDLENAGLLSFIKEGNQDTIHLVVNPAFDQFFSDYYHSVVHH